MAPSLDSKYAGRVVTRGSGNAWIDEELCGPETVKSILNRYTGGKAGGDDTLLFSKGFACYADPVRVSRMRVDTPSSEREALTRDLTSGCVAFYREYFRERLTAMENKVARAKDAAADQAKEEEAQKAAAFARARQTTRNFALKGMRLNTPPSVFQGLSKKVQCKPGKGPNLQYCWWVPVDILIPGSVDTPNGPVQHNQIVRSESADPPLDSIGGAPVEFWEARYIDGKLVELFVKPSGGSVEELLEGLEKNFGAPTWQELRSETSSGARTGSVTNSRVFWWIDKTATLQFRILERDGSENVAGPILLQHDAGISEFGRREQAEASRKTAEYEAWKAARENEQRSRAQKDF